MALTLHRDWWAILTRAWSMRLLALSFIADGLDVVADYALPAFMPAGSYLVLSFALKGAALAARVVAQRNLSEDA